MQTKNDHGLTKSAPIEELKALSEAGEFEGYASVFGVADQGGDIVMPGAFRASLINRPAQKVKMLWQHDTYKPIGQWLEVREDNRGLFVKGRLLLDLEKGKEAHTLLMAGALDGLSIGYRTVQAEYDRDTEIRHLKEVELREISLVTFPMLEVAGVSLVKGDAMPTEREFEAFLRDAGFSRQQSKAIIADGYKSLRSERDAGGNGDGVAEALQQLAASFRG